MVTTPFTLRTLIPSAAFLPNETRISGHIRSLYWQSAFHIPCCYYVSRQQLNLGKYYLHGEVNLFLSLTGFSGLAEDGGVLDWA